MTNQRESKGSDVNDNDVKFAREMLETLAHMKSASIYLPVPDSSAVFIETVIADCFRKLLQDTKKLALPQSSLIAIISEQMPSINHQYLGIKDTF